MEKSKNRPKKTVLIRKKEDNGATISDRDNSVQKLQEANEERNKDNDNGLIVFCIIHASYTL